VRVNTRIFPLYAVYINWDIMNIDRSEYLISKMSDRVKKTHPENYDTVATRSVPVSADEKCSSIKLSFTSIRETESS
jgi:hypothetical protein